MDESTSSVPRNDLCGQIDTDAVPIAAGIQPSAKLDYKLGASQRESSTITYCGTEQQVSEGFAIALRAMGIETNFLPWGTAPDTAIPNREDT